MIPGMNSRLNSIGEKAPLVNKKSFGRNRGTKVSEREITNPNTSNLRDRIGNFPITPGGMINYRFGEITSLASEFMVYVKTEKTISSIFPGGFGD